MTVDTVIITKKKGTKVTSISCVRCYIMPAVLGCCFLLIASVLLGGSSANVSAQSYDQQFYSSESYTGFLSYYNPATGISKIYPPWECGITGQIIEEEDPFEVDPGFAQDPFRFQKEIQQRNFDYRNGCRIGTVLGSAQGISDGYNDRIAEREANPSNNYVSPSETDLCVLFEDFYETRCVLPSNSSQIIPYPESDPLIPYLGNDETVLNFVQGYLGAFPVAYNAGYYAGYSLDKVVDQRYQLLDGVGSVNAETVLGPTAEREQEEEDANISTDGGNDNSSRYSRWWSPY